MHKKPFIIIEALIYLSFIILDILNISFSVYLKYTGIILCLIYAITNKNKLISIAMAFTLIADFFLLVINKYYEVGVSSFIIAQATYCYFLYKNKVDIKLMPRIIIIVILEAILIITKNFSLLYMLVIIYFSTLVMNTITSFQNKDLRLFSIGLVLFVCCDICVGLFNILPYSFLYEVVAMGMWIFYLPSQVMIAIGSILPK